MSKAIKFKNKNNEPIYPCPYFPIGYIYLSTVEIDPSIYFGGKWEQIKDRFLLTAGDTYKNGAIGGEANHRLTISEMPNHSHNYSSGRWYWAEKDGGGDVITNQTGTSYIFTRTTTSTGGNNAHNNMPPYLVVYAWKRVG